MEHGLIAALRRVQVKHRLSLALIAILIPAMLISLVMLRQVSQSDNDLGQMMSRTVGQLMPLVRLEFHIEQARLALEQDGADDPAPGKTLVERIDHEFSRLRAGEDITEQLNVELNAAYQAWAQAEPLVTRMQAPTAPESVSKDEVTRDDGALRGAIDQLQRVHASMLQAITARYEQEQDEQRLYQRVLLAAWALGFAVIAVAVYLLSASILRPLRDLREAAVALQQGRYDARTRLAVQGNDEFAAVGEAFNAMVARVAQARDQLLDRAMQDVLTGLLNRRGLESALPPACASPGPAGVLLIDLDHFKLVNDAFGHDAGDQVLMAVADQMREVAHAGDQLGRYGGDEFMMILPGRDSADISALSQELIGRVERWGVEHHLPVTISVGVACKMQAPSSRDVMVQAADAALMTAKRAGRAAVVVKEIA